MYIKRNVKREKELTVISNPTLCEIYVTEKAVDGINKVQAVLTEFITNGTIVQSQIIDLPTELLQPMIKTYDLATGAPVIDEDVFAAFMQQAYGFLIVPDVVAAPPIEDIPPEENTPPKAP